MIAYTVLLLFFIGIFSSIKVGVKVDKVLAFVTFASIFLVFLNFLSGMNSSNEHIFSFMWNTSQMQDLKFEIISNPYNYSLVLPIFLLTLLSLFNNLLFRNEERRSAYAAVLIFNLVAMILLITSNNFVQLITALFVIDILALFMIGNDEAGKRYGVLNLLADMVLFTVFAVINSRVQSLDLKQILLYQKLGFHIDFSALAGLTAIFMKLGFGILQIGMIGLKETRMHRIQNVMFLSSPFAAIILLLKLSKLWSVSAYFAPYLHWYCVFTVLWAWGGSLAAEYVKAKLIYWLMGFWAFIILLLQFNGFVWNPEFMALMVEMFVYAGIYYLIYFYNNRAKSLLYMMQMRVVYKKRIAVIFGLLFLFFMAAANTLSRLCNDFNCDYIAIYAGLFMFSVAVVWGQIYGNNGKRKRGIQHDIKFKWLISVELVGLCSWLLLGAEFENPLILGSAVLFGVLCLLRFLNKLSFLYYISWLQKKDLLWRFYLLQIKSLRLCGKLFSLVVNRIFLEKIVLALISSFSVVIFRVFRRLHTNKVSGIMIAAIVLGLMLGYSYLKAEVSNG